MSVYLVPGSTAGPASWQVGVIAFGFVLYVLLVGYLLERWQVRLHA